MAKGSVHRETGVGEWDEEMGIRPPESIVKFRKDLCASCGGEYIFARARHCFEGKTEARERI